MGSHFNALLEAHVKNPADFQLEINLNKKYSKCIIFLITYHVESEKFPFSL